MAPYKSYTDQETALRDLTLLRENNIEADLAQESVHGVHTYHLNVPDLYLEQASSLLFSVESTTSDESNFMADYSDDELKQIIVNQIDYAQVMVVNAKSTLLERYPDFDLSGLEESQQSVYDAKLKQQIRGIRANGFGLALAYLFALSGGLFGLASGWFIEVSKTTGVDGKKYPTYDTHSRRHGKFVKWIGMLMLVGLTLLTLLTTSFHIDKRY